MQSLNPKPWWMLLEQSVSERRNGPEKSCSKIEWVFMGVVVLQLPMRDSYPCPESKLQTNHSYWSLICFKAAWLKNWNFTEFCEPLWRLAWLTVTDCRCQSLSFAHFAVGRCMPLCSALLDDYSNVFLWALSFRVETLYCTHIWAKVWYGLHHANHHGFPM